jgi:nucleoside-diphosphate-sugar epimerase
MTSPQVVALTGGTGFVGSNILTCLLDVGYHVRVLARNPQPSLPLSAQIEVIHGDLQDLAALKKLISGCHSVVHCAGRVRGKQYAEFEADNSLATENLYRLAAQETSLSSFIYISSLAARHPHLSAYAKSKQSAEETLKNQTNWIIIRPPALYGPNDTELRPLFDSLKKGINIIPCNKENRFSLLHVSDLSQIILLALNNRLEFNRIYEPDDGKNNGYDWSEINAIAAQVFQRKIYTITIPKMLLKSLAHLNVLFSDLRRKSPMLSTDKVNELCFPNWVADPDLSVPDWQAMTDFEQGLKNLYSPNN